jgi:hypothetical protein
MPHDMTNLCDECRHLRELFYVRSVDRYLCEECIMILAAATAAATKESEGET